MKNNKQILIAKEKHGNRYFDASTPELLAESAFKLLKERWDEGYIYWKPIKPDGKNYLSEQQIAALPTESLRAQETKNLLQYQKYLREYEWELEEYNKIKDCVENGLKNHAWKLLQNRSNYEYENVELETLE